jgi:hypothetical protein
VRLEEGDKPDGRDPPGSESREGGGEACRRAKMGRKKGKLGRGERRKKGKKSGRKEKGLGHGWAFPFFSFFFCKKIQTNSIQIQILGIQI